MPPIESVQALTKNDKLTFLKSSEVLINVATAILKDPEDEELRKVPLGNPCIISKILEVDGAMQVLFDMGFVEDTEFLRLPKEAPLSKVKSICKSLKRIVKLVKGPKQEGNIDYPPDIPVSQLKEALLNTKSFHHHLSRTYVQVKMYEIKSLQQKALSLIPLEKMKETAAINHKKTEEVSEADILLLELLEWFKNDFFSWTDSPSCYLCKFNTVPDGMSLPNKEEDKWHAARVECFKCLSCKKITRFPRYNHPGKLLETRTGRCGEYANCFTLCARAVGFEARYVLDFTDHVWTEVFSEHQQRWLHCDPCEAICDLPLVYESGWNKKLNYIFAFSIYDIQDVTWRYTANQKEVLKRRTLYDEKELSSWLISQRAVIQSRLSEAERSKLLKRTVNELMSFFAPRTPGKGEEGQGRTSGSLQWRMARGETGGVSTTSYTFTPTKAEKEAKCLEVWYNCSFDYYQRVSDGNEKLPGWNNYAYSSSNIQRKQERDWRMVYLARTIGSETANIVWKWDFEGSGLVIDKVEVLLLGKSFETGRIRWKFSSDEESEVISPSPYMQYLKLTSGSTVLTVSADLYGGAGDIAWQQSQLFRQGFNDSRCPMKVKINLRTK